MREAEKATTLCTLCPKLCRYSCPVADADQNEATTPWGKMTTLKMVEEKRLPMTPQTMGLAYKCVNCRRSQGACELNNPVSATLDLYRIQAFRAGLSPQGVYRYGQKFQQFDNPFGIDLAKKIESLFPERTHDRKKIVYFPGCTEIAQDEPKNKSTIRKTLERIHALDSKEVGLYREPIQCCGYPLYAAGDWDNFVQLAEVNSHSLSEYNLVLSGAPACLYTMEILYRDAGHPTSAKFLHIVEYLHKRWRPPPIPLLSKERVSAKGRRVRSLDEKRSVAYHDPCYLGRYRKIYEEPRELIRIISGTPPQEFPRNRESSYCCGAGGLLPVSFPETAEKITKNRLEEFKSTGADLLVSSCPTCVRRFKKFGKGIRVKNLMEYLTDGFESSS